MKKKIPTLEFLTLIGGEALVCLLTVGLFLLLGLLTDIPFFEFSYTVITGALLGAVIVLANYLFLNISVNRAINNFMALRGDREMDEEEAAKFAAENSAPIQNAIKLSFIVRTVSMLLTLVIAFILDVFNPLATVIPILALRPLLTLGALVSQRLAPQEGFATAKKLEDPEFTDLSSASADPSEASEETNTEKKESEDIGSTS